MKRALITGGQRGIGLGIAKALDQAGFEVVLMSERAPDNAEVTEAFATLPRATYVQHDLRDLDAIPAALEQVGPITTLISNAGVPAMARADLLDMTPESFDHTHAINLRGAVFLAQAVARRMLDLPADPYRSICFVTSVSARMVSVERAEYCMSKAGASMAASAFAARLAPEGIGVFELQPGIIATDMTAGVRDTYDARIADGLVPANRWGQPSDIADTIVP
ncbi:MAG: 3-ketoacyl-ACP reductase, partial [Pseudomonadota bacterium]